jgi:methionyl-tRNA formyltransferase
LKAIPQPKGGSFHRLRDKKAFEHLLTNGWETRLQTSLEKHFKPKLQALET